MQVGGFRGHEKQRLLCRYCGVGVFRFRLGMDMFIDGLGVYGLGTVVSKCSGFVVVCCSVRMRTASSGICLCRF